MQFDTILTRWLDAQHESVETRLAYERIYAEALTTAGGKTAEVREAEADIASLDARRSAKHAAVEAQTLLHRLVYVRTYGATGVGVAFADYAGFEAVLGRWRDAQHDCVDAWLDHEAEYARALIAADGKSAETRKAQAKLRALDAQRKAEHSAATAQGLLHSVLYLRTAVQAAIGALAGAELGQAPGVSA